MNAAAHVYRLYGLRVHSAIPLPAPLAASELPPFDLQVGWGERIAAVDAAPAGRILGETILPNGRGYTLVDAGDSYALCFYHTAEVWIAPDLRSARVHLAEGVAPAIAGLLVVGNLLACILALAGESVLHASAVAFDAAAVAFLGRSGMGKSSLAALLCAHGARLITDDLLRLQADGDGWRCYPGAGQLRLRPDAAARLAGGFPAARLTPTADDRVAVEIEDALDMPRLAAIVIPHPSHHCLTLRLERLPPARALLSLMAFPRIAEAPQRNRCQHRLDFLGRIAASVPLYEAEIPWGMPDPSALAALLAEGVGVMPRVT